MKKFSNGYMIVYSLVLAAIVATLLSVVAIGLKNKQQANIINEKKQQLLTTIGVNCTSDEVSTIYGKYFKEELTINGSDGTPLTLYKYEKDGKHGYVIPTQGNGLWGKIYANIALDDDLNTIVGATFSHDSETPGLGAEIASESFSKQFIGKKILNDDGKVVSVSVVKHADKNDAHQVDAISGGTMTSNGVDEMLQTVLSRYQSYIDSCRNQ